MYNGVEVFWLYVGHGDSVFLRSWTNDKPKHILIDGGYKDRYETRLKPFLKELEVEHVDAIVSTHPDRDHIGGLIRLAEDDDFTIGKAWLHRPTLHSQAQGLSTLMKMSFTANSELDFIQCSLRDEDDLEKVLERRGVPMEEPFAGSSVENVLKVWGPTKERYEELLPRFTSAAELQKATQIMAASAAKETFAARFEAHEAAKLEENPQTSPENDSSVVSFLSHSGTRWLFTADAGHQAVHDALDHGGTAGFDWTHAPHHGSRSNMTEKLLDRLATKRLVYSAEPKLNRHPHGAVQDAARKRRIKQHGTWHKSVGHKRTGAGSIPDWGQGDWEEL